MVKKVENPITTDDLEVPFLFRNLHMFICVVYHRTNPALDGCHKDLHGRELRNNIRQARHALFRTGKFRHGRGMWQVFLSFGSSMKRLTA